MRKLSKTLHQILSIVVGIFISIICFSGAMLIFENEFTEWQNPDLYNVTPPRRWCQTAYVSIARDTGNPAARSRNNLYRHKRQSLKKL